MPRKHTDAEISRVIAERCGARLKAARLSLGLTQEELAEEVEITPEAYGRLERGAALPSIPTLLRLCESLQVTTDELLTVGGGVVLRARQPLSPRREDELVRLSATLGDRERRALVSLLRELAAQRSGPRRRGEGSAGRG